MLKDIVKIFLLSIMFILTGCSPANKGSKLLLNIETRLKKEQGIEHGAIVAIYDLGGLGNSRCLHAKDYGLIVNDEHANSRFINKVSSRCKKRSLEQRAKAKLAVLKSSLARLHEKYMILSSSDIRKIDLNEGGGEESIFDNVDDEASSNSGNYLRELHEIDQIVRHVPMFFPVYSARLTSNFGMRKHPIKRCKKFHYGTDFAGMKGSQIYSAAYGKVISIERVTGYGNTVVIDHGKQFRTRYAHLSKVLVDVGANVIRGQKVGLQGKTGAATSEHLHFEVLFKGQHINPIDFVGDGHRCSLR